MLFAGSSTTTLSIRSVDVDAFRPADHDSDARVVLAAVAYPGLAEAEAAQFSLNVLESHGTLEGARSPDLRRAPRTLTEIARPGPTFGVRHDLGFDRKPPALSAALAGALEHVPWRRTFDGRFRGSGAWRR